MHSNDEFLEEFQFEISMELLSLHLLDRITIHQKILNKMSQLCEYCSMRLESII
jgi:hypothetical protein